LFIERLVEDGQDGLVTRARGGLFAADDVLKACDQAGLSSDLNGAGAVTNTLIRTNPMNGRHEIKLQSTVVVGEPIQSLHEAYHGNEARQGQTLKQNQHLIKKLGFF